MINNSRSYVIHLNLEHGADNLDILESYYFARVLDREMLKATEVHGRIHVEQAIKETEWHYENEYDSQRMTAHLKEAGWSLDYIYLE